MPIYPLNPSAGGGLPLSGGTMDADAVIAFANGSKIQEGTVDMGTGGAGGISEVCAAEYEKNFQAGRTILRNSIGGTIRESTGNFSAEPGVNDDTTKGYIAGSRWVTDSGIVFVCSNPAEGAATWYRDPLVWTFTSGEVTDGKFGTDSGNLVVSSNQGFTPTFGGNLAVFGPGWIILTELATGFPTTIQVNAGATIPGINYIIPFSALNGLAFTPNGAYRFHFCTTPIGVYLTPTGDGSGLTEVNAADVNPAGGSIGAALGAKLDTAAQAADVNPAGTDIAAALAALSAAIAAGGPQVGDVKAFAGAAAPSKWAVCDGAEISRSTYADLFAEIGTTYGAGDASTTFNLPDCRGRVIAGVQGAADRMPTGLTDLGQTGGARGVTLGVGEIPSHAHYIGNSDQNNGFASSADYALKPAGGGMIQSDATGGGGEHANVQPTIVMNLIIYTGVA